MAPDLTPTPVAGTPSASKSPHPDRSDPDRAEPGHCSMPGVNRVEPPNFARAHRRHSKPIRPAPQESSSTRRGRMAHV